MNKTVAVAAVDAVAEEHMMAQAGVHCQNSNFLHRSHHSPWLAEVGLRSSFGMAASMVLTAQARSCRTRRMPAVHIGMSCSFFLRAYGRSIEPR